MEIVSKEGPHNNIVTLTVKVSAEEFAPALERSFRKNAAKMNVPGFRKGKAPRKMLEKMFGAGIFYEDAAGYAYPEAYAAAVEASGIKPVDSADVAVQSISEEDGFVFEAKVTVSPEVKLGQYKGLAAVYPELPPPDAKVDAELTRLRERNASMQTIERPAAAGDIVVLDYEGRIDGEPFEGGSVENYTLELGSGKMVPGFETQIEGHCAGDEFEFCVTFPEDYHSDVTAGREVTFKCLLRETREKLMPELDDEFAKDVSEFNTLEELRRSIEENVTAEHVREADEIFENALMDIIVNGIDADIPEVMVENKLDDILDRTAHRFAALGISFYDYLSMTGKTLEDVRDERREEALRLVKASLALSAVAEAEGLSVTEEELQEELERIAQNYSADVEDIKGRINTEPLREDLITRKTIKLIADSAVRLSADDNKGGETQ